jgi:hypothetical protein
MRHPQVSVRSAWAVIIHIFIWQLVAISPTCAQGRGKDPTGTSDPAATDAEPFLIESQEKRNGLVGLSDPDDLDRSYGSYWIRNNGFTPYSVELNDHTKFNSAYLLSQIEAMPWYYSDSQNGTIPYSQSDLGLFYVASGFFAIPREHSNWTLYLGRVEHTRFRISATSSDHPPLRHQFLKVTQKGLGGTLNVSQTWETIQVEPFIADLPADEMKTAWYELKAPMTDGQDTRVSLLQVEVRGYATGERNSSSSEANEKYRHLIPDPDDYTGSKTELKTELKIVQWGDNDIFDANNNGEFDHAKFKQDVDIFRIRLPDIDPPAGTAEHRIKIWTVDAAGAILDQGAEVDLNVFDNFHETAALGLVADDDTDDTFTVEGKADGALGDRTYRAKLGGKLKFQWLTCPGTGEKPIFEIPIPVKKIVTAKGFLLKGTTDAATATYWFERAKKIYSAIGVDLQYTLKTIDPLPAGVVLSNRFEIPEETAGYLHKMMPETKALMDDAGCQVDPGTIPVFFVNELEPAAQGVTNTPSYMTPGEKKYGGAIFINSKHTQESVLAHELAHVLLDAQHDPSSNALWNDYFLSYDRHRTNIRFGNQSMLNIWSETGIGAHRRLADTMRSRIWKSSYAKVPEP